MISAPPGNAGAEGAKELSIYTSSHLLCRFLYRSQMDIDSSRQCITIVVVAVPCHHDVE